MAARTPADLKSVVEFAYATLDLDLLQNKYGRIRKIVPSVCTDIKKAGEDPDNVLLFPLKG